MACTATATVPVAREIASRFGMREPLQVRSGFDRPNLSFDVVAARGHGLEGAPPGAARGGAGGPGEPAGDRLLRHPQGHRGGDRRRCAKRGSPRAPTTPGWNRRSGARSRNGSWRRRGRPRRDRRHQRLRHGRRQSRRALGLAHDDPDLGRGLLPGGRPRRPRRPTLPRRAAGDEGRPRAASSASTNSARATPSWRSPTSAAGAPTTRSKPSSTTSAAAAARCSTTSPTASAGAPLERCCDVCDSRDWLPDPETIAVRTGAPAAAAPAAPAAPSSAAADAPLFEELKAWRLRAAEGKPAYTVANNRTLDRDRRHPAAERARAAGDLRRRPRLHREVRPRGAGDHRRRRLRRVASPPPEPAARRRKGRCRAPGDDPGDFRRRLRACSARAVFHPA